MESEKVKEIKKALECWQESVMLSTDENYVSHKVYNREILDYILVLEIENERLKEENGDLSCDLDYANKKLINAEFEIDDCEDRIANLENIGLNEEMTVAEYLSEMERLKDRVAELESENETIKFNMQETEKASFFINQMNGNLILENQELKDRIAELEKVNADNVDVFVECAKVLDETLKECMDE